MSFQCAICTERLDRLPPQQQSATSAPNPANDDVNIAATPCGHIFHKYCIQRWLTGNLQSSKQCPNCRKSVPGITTLPLYPTTYDPLNDTLLVEGAEGSNCDHSHFNHQISGLKKLIEQHQDKIQEAELMVKVQTDVADGVKKKLDLEKARSDNYLFHWKQCESYKSFAEEKTKECNEVKEKLKSYQLIDNLVRNVQDDVSFELESLPPTKESLKRILESHNVLIKEYQNMSKNLDNTKKQQEKDRMEMAKLKKKYEKLNHDHSELQSVHNISGGEGGSTPSFPRSQNVHQLVHSTRTPLSMGIESISRKIAQSEENKVDDDVPLIQPFSFGGSKKQNKIPSKNTSKKPVVPETAATKQKQTSAPLDLNPPPPAAQKKFLFTKKYPSSDNILSSRGDKSDSAAGPSKKARRDVDHCSQPSSSNKDLLARSTNPNGAHKNTQKSSSKNHKLDQTIEIADSSDEDSDFPLRGNIPGMKVTQVHRKDIKSTKKLKT